MEMSNNAASVTADDALDGGKYVYYNYVIAAADNNNATDAGDAHGSAAIITYCDKMHVSSIAQQEYPMLVQQCIENCSIEDDPMKSGDVQNNNNNSSTHLLENISQATLNVVLTAIDQPANANESAETIIPDEIIDFEDIEEELDDEDDYLDDEELDDDVGEDDYESEPDLTSLAWLSDPAQSSAMNMLALGGVGVDEDDDDHHRPSAQVGKPTVNEPTTRPKTPAAMRESQQPQPSKKSKAPSKASTAPQQSPANDKNVTQERFNKFMLQVQQSQTIYTSNATAYRQLITEKPPFNYAQIIAMAMMECGRMTLKDICTWIRERFAFYRHQDNWNNSIRHNLSLHFCFTKIARDKTEKGKGGYWELSMNVTKGEKKRVRNRSKRALAILAATGQQPAAKRARRATAVGNRKKAEATAVNTTDATTIVAPETITTTMTTMSSPTTEPPTTPAKYVPANSIVAEYELQHFADNELAASEAAATAVANELCAQFAGGVEYAHIPADLLQESEIFLGCEIPLSGDCIIIPYTSNCSNSNQAAALIAAQPQPLTLTIPTTTPNSPQSASSQSQDSTAISPQQSAATFIAHGLTQTMGPNVIVEQMPYSVVATSANSTTQSVFDQVGDIERQFSSMAQLPDPDLVEYGVYFDYVNEW